MHIHNVDKNKIKEIEISSDDIINNLSTLFKMFSDPTRLKIMQTLLNNELNVCEIANLLKMSHSAISHQLATLKLARLVKAKKVGKEVYYSLSDDHVKTIIEIGKEHVLED